MTELLIRDISPRLSGQAHPIETADKIALIDRLTGAGLRAVEVSSFVRPDLVPGLADAEEVFAGINRPVGVSLECCVGNVRGLQRAIDVGADAAWFLLSADEEFARNNIGRTTGESLAELERMAKLAQESAITLGTYIIFAWGGPNSPPRPPADLDSLTGPLTDLGVRDWILADSCGYASPVAATTLAEHAISTLGGPETITVQIHDGRGMGLACIPPLVGLGITKIDAALAGTGGHPAMPATPGAGVCTEDLIQMLHLDGHHTGVDLDELVSAANWLADGLGVASNGFMRHAGPVPEQAAATNAFSWR